MTARATGRNRAARLRFDVDFGGNVFGCPDPAPEGTLLRYGTGVNRWNAKGFRIGGDSVAFGTLNLVYTHRGRTLNGTGTNPRCSPGLGWRLRGRFVTLRRFTGTVDIALASGQMATSVLDLRR
jgi:hypothetical protein